MFFFGDPVQMAQFYLDSAIADDGPTLPQTPFEQLSPAQQGVAFHVRLSCIQDCLCTMELKRKLWRSWSSITITCSSSMLRRPEFAQAVDNHRHVFLPEPEKSNINKYRKLAGLPALP